MTKRLTTKEFEIMKGHTIEGANLINKIYKDRAARKAKAKGI